MMLFGGSLIPRMSVEQAVRLPELLTHYQQHQQQENCDLNFLAFLIEHYVLDSDHHAAPGHNHTRLPSQDGSSPAYDFNPTLYLTYSPLIIELHSLAVFRLQFMNAYQHFSSLFQPPRR